MKRKPRGNGRQRRSLLENLRRKPNRELRRSTSPRLRAKRIKKMPRTLERKQQMTLRGA